MFLSVAHSSTPCCTTERNTSYHDMPLKKMPAKDVGETQELKLPDHDHILENLQQPDDCLDGFGLQILFQIDLLKWTKMTSGQLTLAKLFFINPSWQALNQRVSREMEGSPKPGFARIQSWTILNEIDTMRSLSRTIH
uniref:Uncharacterized protein n=1 Tax=Sphaerodactylus townsendi TaxID=933632 RepID=A0ACB8EZ96_9SAUR